MSKLNKNYVNECIVSVLNASQEKRRKFVETIELQVTLKDYDPTKDKRFAGVIKLRHSPKRTLKACIFADAYHLDEAKKIGLAAMELDDLKKLNKDKKLVKKLVSKYDVFLASETVLKQMPKVLGSALHVFNKVGKFPQVVTHHDNMNTKIDEIKSSIKFQLKKTLCLGTAIGHVAMTEEQVVQNVYQSVNYLVSLLKKNWNNVRSLHIKSTMGKPQRLY